MGSSPTTGPEDLTTQSELFCPVVRGVYGGGPSGLLWYRVVVILLIVVQITGQRGQVRRRYSGFVRNPSSASVLFGRCRPVWVPTPLTCRSEDRSDVSRLFHKTTSLNVC